ncbi:limbic system-associated membrane protein [Procambarus clarkii]|uniref:limbic system-associated membrane protein n=1 Tax=Procambarus clarkii TaxID=6728 RepID=UPI001E675B55|nr:zwei Ig domain protein zig-8-like isoform X2 [Procambarus clarkii]XP_045615931.1 zwei Ig domain protein zig-8-like isoform X2 [Procambarus clarkii]
MPYSPLVRMLIPFLSAAIVVVSVGDAAEKSLTIAAGDHSSPLGPAQPYFVYHESINVTGMLGKTAVLNCRVKNIGNKTVSWIRHRDIHLLTVGGFTYTSDARFSARHVEGSEDWLLLVHYLQERDAGQYACQISTTPPHSHFVHLTVVEPETVIEGPADVYINTGSRLSLTCSVRYSPEPPAFIFWYHDDKLVPYGKGRDEVVVSTEGGRGDEVGVVSTSQLLVQVVKQRHSGVYRCAPASSNSKEVTVHVIAGDQPAAIVHDNNGLAENSGVTDLNTHCVYFLLGSLNYLLMRLS